jgi:hypothetical protein
MLCIIVEKIDESPAGSYSVVQGYRVDTRGILCFKVPRYLDEIDICHFMYRNKELFAGIGGCYKGIGDHIRDSTSAKDLFDRIDRSSIDGDSESLVQIFWCDTDNIPAVGSDYLLRLKYCYDSHTDVLVIHDDCYDEDEEREDEWKYDSGVYIRKLNPDYVFEVGEEYHI